MQEHLPTDPTIDPRRVVAGTSVARAHRLYFGLRIVGAIGISCTALLHAHASGRLGPRDLTVLLCATAWPPVMWAAIVLGRRTRAADRVVLLDALPVALIAAVGGLSPYGVLIVIGLFNATAVLGARGLASSMLLAGATLGSSFAGGLLLVEQAFTHWYVTGSAALWTYLFLLGAALTAHRTRRELKATRDALDQLRRQLELRVEERTAQLAEINRAIRRFVPFEFIASLGHTDVTTLRLGDAISREVTILFADVRGFTTRAERLAPAETFAFLNDLLGRLGPIIRQHHGFVDKYIGDAIMALFLEDPADAVRAAVAMQRACAAAAREAPGSPAVQIGVGVHHGAVRMGLIGEDDRVEATVIADAVNTCARVEALTRALEASILVTADVAQRLPADLRDDSRSLGLSPIRGRVGQVELFELFAHEDEKLRQHKRLTRPSLARAIASFEAGQRAEAEPLLRELCAAAPDDRPLAWWATRASNPSEPVSYQRGTASPKADH